MIISIFVNIKLKNTEICQWPFWILDTCCPCHGHVTYSDLIMTKHICTHMQHLCAHLLITSVHTSAIHMCKAYFQGLLLTPNHPNKVCMHKAPLASKKKNIHQQLLLDYHNCDILPGVTFHKSDISRIFVICVYIK